MHPIRRRKLSVIALLLVVAGVVSALILYALRQNIALYYTPSQLCAGEAPLHRSIRVGGVVVKNSLVHLGDDLQVRFLLTDYAHTVEITYKGILPDLFREGQGVVTQGVLLDTEHVQASQVLAKHDENYMPPEVKDTLKPVRSKVRTLLR